MSGHIHAVPHLYSGAEFQSPDGDSLCPDLEFLAYHKYGYWKFQSPDGDSLCPDTLPNQFPLGPSYSGFSPLTGILYVRTKEPSKTWTWASCVSVP